MALAFIGNGAMAEAPDVPTPAPYIVLSDRLDEPNGYGFCMDTVGPGRSDLVHTHSCKPPRGARGDDVRFSFEAASGRVMSFAFDGQCVQVLRARGVAVFALLACSDHPGQVFVYDAADQTLRPQQDLGLCVSVSDRTVPAGPWVKRDLRLTECDGTPDMHKAWTIVPE